MRKHASFLPAVLLALFLSRISALAMESNLALPFDAVPSGPADARLAFFSCQNDNLLFTNEKEIQIEVRGGTRCIALHYGVCRNMFDKPFITGDAEPIPGDRFRLHIPTEKLYPGFYDINVVLDSGDGKPIPGRCTFGWKVSDLAITSDKPADFEAFWKKGKEELTKVPLDAKVGDFQTFDNKAINAYNVASAALPDDYDPQGHRTDQVESAKVDFAGMGHLRIHAWLAKPLGDGPFPAMLILPGAGFAARPRPLEHARHGFLALDMQVHGQEVDLPGKYPSLPGYYDNPVWDPPTAYYYYNVYLNCIQAINYLESRPDVDKSRIVVVGGSQGGRLSISLSGLDPRIAATCAAIVHNSNVPFLKWFDAANKATPPQDGMDQEAPPALPDTPEGRAAGYFDTMNFAPYVHCPVFMNAGLIDNISPPTGSWAVFNRLASKDKTVVPLPGKGHDWSAEFDRRAWRWLDKELKLQPVPGPALRPTGT